MHREEKIYSFGKNNVFINEDLIVHPRSTTHLSSRIPDRLRALLREYYSVQADGTIRYEDNFDGSSVIKSHMIERGTAPVLRLSFLAEPRNEQEDDQRMNTLGALINTSATFADFHFTVQLPVPFGISKKMAKVGRIQYIDSHSRYNFLVGRYERMLQKNPSIPENVLPNFYTLYAEGVYKQKNVLPLNTLNGKFNPGGNITAKFISALGSNEENIKDRYSEYFDKFAQSANNLLKKKSERGDQVVNNLSSKYNVYTFTDATIPLLTTEASKGEAFPFYNEIKFSTDTKSLFADILWELKLGEEIVKEVVSNPTPGQAKFGKSSQEYIPSMLRNEPPEERYNFSTAVPNVWDIATWIKQNLFSNRPMPGVVIGKNRNIQGVASQGIEEHFVRTLLSAKINNLSKNKTRTLKEMYSGVPVYSEVVFYRIQKFLEEDLSTPISTYFIPNSSKLEECRFLDTQVKYGGRYAYTITSYVLVIGNQYSYNTFNRIDSTTADIGVGSVPLMKLVQVPVTVVRNMTVLDNPPMPPEVSIVPYKGIGRKVLINVNGSTGDREMLPVVIQASDKAKIDLQRSSQRRAGSKIRFKTDDTPGSFEVFRTTKKPLSYSDFEGTRIRTLSTRQLATSSAFDDKISTNVKYYYTFRSIDLHGNVSNPSPVYQVEMKSGSGAPFLIVNVVDFQEEQMKNKRPLKPMRRYVQIIPTTPQGLLDAKASIDSSGVSLLGASTAKGVRNVVLGVSDEKLWGKKFRFRFTSKKTGRKIDLDVIFRAEHQLKQS